MKTYTSVVLALAAAVVSAGAASKQLPTVEVRAEDSNAIYISCTRPVTPSAASVARLLNVSDEDRANRLRFKLAKVAAEACAAGTARILVQRSDDGRDLRWVAGN